MRYILFDHNEETDESIDIKEEAFVTLIECCFKYSCFFSLDFLSPEDEQIADLKLSEFTPSVSKSVEKLWKEYYKINYHRELWLFPSQLSKDELSEYLKNNVICKYEAKRKYYVCNVKTKNSLITIFDNIFDYYYSAQKKPENLIFYRKDGSVFFSSNTHDGECFLYPFHDENVSEILQLGPWKLL